MGPPRDLGPHPRFLEKSCTPTYMENPKQNNKEKSAFEYAHCEHERGSMERQPVI